MSSSLHLLSIQRHFSFGAFPYDLLKCRSGQQVIRTFSNTQWLSPLMMTVAHGEFPQLSLSLLDLGAAHDCFVGFAAPPFPPPRVHINKHKHPTPLSSSFLFQRTLKLYRDSQPNENLTQKRCCCFCYTNHTHTLTLFLQSKHFWPWTAKIPLFLRVGKSTFHR